MLKPPSASPEVAPLNGSHSASQLAPTPAPPTPNPGSTSGDDVLDVGALLSKLWRQRRLMLTTWALVLLAGTLLTLLQNPIYQATCSILITSPNDNNPVISDSLRSLLQASQPRSVGTQLAIMRSYPVQRAAVLRLSPSEQQSAQNFHDLEVRPQRDSDAIDIIAQSTDARIAARLANALSQEYMAQYQEQNRLQVVAGTREVAAQLAGARARLDEAAQALKTYKLGQGTVNLGEESSARLEQVNQIEITLRDLRAERADNVARIKSLAAQIAGQPLVLVTPNTIVRSPEAESLRTQLNTLEITRIATQRRYRVGSPEVRAIEIQLADLRKRLASATKTEINSWTRAPNPVVQLAKQDSARAQTQINAIDARIAELRGAGARARAQEALLPEREYRLNQLVGDQTTLQQTYALLNQKYQSLLASEGSKLTTARTLSPARVPKDPIRPRRALNLALSALLGGVLALALGLLADHADDRVRSSRDAEDAAQLPVLAQIPPVKSGQQRVLSAQIGAHNYTPLLESFRLLRTNLMAPGAGGVPTLPRSILVTSPRANEGSALCALNLAIASALSGKNVLLIEADLRSPTLHSLLGLEAGRGLSEVARLEIGLDEALQTTGVPNLRFLGCGALTSGAGELLESDAARQVLLSAIARADCAILSSPPVLGFADTLILANLAQCALLVVAGETSLGSDIAHARQTLVRTQIALPGLVLVGVKET